MRWNKYLPFAIIYFFLNIVALPFGLTYTALLAPFFYAWILLKRKKEVLLPFMAVFLPFVIAHFWIVGVNSREYVITLLNITAIYIFCQGFYTWLKLDTEKEKIFKTLLVINIILCLIAIVVYFTPAAGIFWIQQNFTSTVKDFRRLKMFTYEASHYALMFTPLFLFYFLRLYIRKKQDQHPMAPVHAFCAVYSFFFDRCNCMPGCCGIYYFFYSFPEFVYQKKNCKRFHHYRFFFGSHGCCPADFFPGQPDFCQARKYIFLE